jgi:hypothetical protein
MGKMILTSKTIWVNVIALALASIQIKTGLVIPGELQGILLALVNVILRMVTKEPVAWK